MVGNNKIHLFCLICYMDVIFKKNKANCRKMAWPFENLPVAAINPLSMTLNIALLVIFQISYRREMWQNNVSSGPTTFNPKYKSIHWNQIRLPRRSGFDGGSILTVEFPKLADSTDQSNMASVQYPCTLARIR